MITFVTITLLDKNLQTDFSARHGDEMIFNSSESAGNHGKQITWFRERIFKGGVVSAIFQNAGVCQVAVGQEHGGALAISHQSRRVAGHNIRPVRVVGDLTKALGFALGAKDLACPVKPLKSRIGLRIHLHQCLQRKLFRHILNR